MYKGKKKQISEVFVFLQKYLIGKKTQKNQFPGDKNWNNICRRFNLAQQKYLWKMKERSAAKKN